MFSCKHIILCEVLKHEKSIKLECITAEIHFHFPLKQKQSIGKKMTVTDYPKKQSLQGATTLTRMTLAEKCHYLLNVLLSEFTSCSTESHTAECRCNECHSLLHSVILNDILIIVILLNGILLNIIKLNATL